MFGKKQSELIAEKKLFELFAKNLEDLLYPKNASETENIDTIILRFGQLVGTISPKLERIEELTEEDKKFTIEYLSKILVAIKEDDHAKYDTLYQDAFSELDEYVLPLIKKAAQTENPNSDLYKAIKKLFIFTKCWQLKEISWKMPEESTTLEENRTSTIAKYEELISDTDYDIEEIDKEASELIATIETGYQLANELKELESAINGLQLDVLDLKCKTEAETILENLKDKLRNLKTTDSREDLDLYLRDAKDAKNKMEFLKQFIDRINGISNTGGANKITEAKGLREFARTYIWPEITVRLEKLSIHDDKIFSDTLAQEGKIVTNINIFVHLARPETAELAKTIESMEKILGTEDPKVIRWQEELDKLKKGEIIRIEKSTVEAAKKDLQEIQKHQAAQELQANREIWTKDLEHIEKLKRFEKGNINGAIGKIAIIKELLEENNTEAATSNLEELRRYIKQDAEFIQSTEELQEILQSRIDKLKRFKSKLMKMTTPSEISEDDLAQQIIALNITLPEKQSFESFKETLEKQIDEMIKQLETDYTLGHAIIAAHKTIAGQTDELTDQVIKTHYDQAAETLETLEKDLKAQQAKMKKYTSSWHVRLRVWIAERTKKFQHTKEKKEAYLATSSEIEKKLSEIASTARKATLGLVGTKELPESTTPLEKKSADAKQATEVVKEFENDARKIETLK